MRTLVRHLSFVAVLCSPLALAQTIQPYHAEPIRPVQARPIQPTGAQPVKPAENSGTIEPYHAVPMKPMAPAGVDPVQGARPFDERLTGTFEVSIPSVSWTTRTYDGPNPIDTTRSGVGASLGLLRIAADGSYSWTKEKAVRSRGKLEEVRPHNYAEQGVRYWRLRSERDEYYLSLTPDGLTLYSPGSNLYAASARRKK